ncbi:MAG: hypothetical protein AAB433_02300 [Nitrospirota bacterium]
MNTVLTDSPHATLPAPPQTAMTPKTIMAYLSRGAEIVMRTPEGAPEYFLVYTPKTRRHAWSAPILPETVTSLQHLELIQIIPDPAATQSIRYTASFRLPRIPQFTETAPLS